MPRADLAAALGSFLLDAFRCTQRRLKCDCAIDGITTERRPEPSPQCQVVMHFTQAGPLCGQQTWRPRRPRPWWAAFGRISRNSPV